MKRTQLITAFILAAASLAWGGQAVHKTVAASPNGVVEISNMAGSLTIEGWDQASVEVSGTLGDGVDELAVSSSGNRVSIEAEYGHRAHRNHSEGSNLVVRLPEGSRIQVETVSADVDLAGVHGPVELETVSGEVRVKAEIENLEVETVSGRVTVLAAVGSTELESVSGNIVVERASGRLDVETVSGAVKILDGSLELFDAETVSGHLDIRALPTAGASFDIESHSGNVDLSIPSGFAARFDVSTFSGRIDNQVGPPASKSSDYGPGRRLNFSSGDGGGRISITTFSGNVSLQAR